MQRILCVAFLGLLAAACGSDPRVGSSVLVEDVDDPAALAADVDGGYFFGERATGRILFAGDLSTTPEPFGQVSVSSRGQQGLLGLAVQPGTGSLFAAYTTDTEQLVVARIEPDAEPELVWSGFAASDGANGGRIAFLNDGRLVIGVGTVRSSAKVDDPDQPNGKMLALSPDGPADQTPTVLSTGWNNPYAFAVTPSGDLWVADNDPGDAPERLARGDGDPVEFVPLPNITAPAGMVAIDDDELWVCGFVSEALLRYRINDAGEPQRSGTVTTDCQLDVIRLADGPVLFSTETDIRVIEP